jgi:hypothetical protein
MTGSTWLATPTRLGISQTATCIWPWRVGDPRLQCQPPYDQFIHRQTAGDLWRSPRATSDWRLRSTVCTGRPTRAAASRRNFGSGTSQTAWHQRHGLSGPDAECPRHDHKFDPIGQKEYYQLAFFAHRRARPVLHFTETAPPRAAAVRRRSGDASRRSRPHPDKGSRATACAEAARSAFQWELGRTEGLRTAAAFAFEDVKAHGDYKPVGKSRRRSSSTATMRTYARRRRLRADDAIHVGSVGATDGTSAADGRSAAPRRRDSAFRGYSLVLDNVTPSSRWFTSGRQRHPGACNKAHPRGRMDALTVTYGSSRRCVRIYVNGVAVECTVVRDRLTRDITHRAEWGDHDTDGLDVARGPLRCRFRRRRR